MGIWRYPLHGMFHLQEHIPAAQRQSELKISEANAGAKLP